MATMVAGEQYYEFDGQLSEIKRQLRQPGGYPYDPVKLKTALQNAIEGIFVEVTETEEKQKAKLKPLLSVVATFRLGSNVISTLAPSKRATFAEWAAAVLGVSTNTLIQTLGELLKERGHIMTEAQVEEMKKATDHGEKTGMRTDGWGNFYFVENEDGSVSVGVVDRGRHDWGADVYSLDSDYRWFTVSRLLVRNLDASKLGA